MVGFQKNEENHGKKLKNSLFLSVGLISWL